MVKFYSNSYSYDYSFSAVSLAYFLRYPNPYSRHVESTDTISRSFDPETQRLTTVRLHLKRSRLPPAILKILPRSALGASDDGRTQSYILETSIVDVKEGWMHAKSQNLDWSNVLSVIERQTFYRQPAETSAALKEDVPTVGKQPVNEITDVKVSVTLQSRIGEQIRKRRMKWGEQASATSVSGGEEEVAVKQGWFSSWSSGAVRSAVEAISLQRTERSQPNAQKGMSVVLSRLRTGGLEAVLEGMRQDRQVDI